MRIFSWNVNGLRAVVKKGFFDWLNSEAPDVVCLQEIKARTEDLEESIRNPDGYHAVWNPAQRKGYSGVAVFTKKKPKSVHLGIGVERFDVEDRHVDSQGYGMVGSVVSFFYWGSTLHGGGSCRDKSL